METVDQPLELQIELMSLSDPTNAETSETPADNSCETPGGKLAEVSAETPGGKLAEVSIDNLEGKSAKTNADTPERKPAEAITETPDRKPEDPSTESSGGNPDVTSADTLEENPATGSAETSEGNPDVANSDTLEENPATGNAETSGGNPDKANSNILEGNPATGNAETSGGNPDVANSDTLEENPATGSAETLGGNPDVASSDTLEGKPAGTSAEIAGGKLATTSAETTGGKLAEASAEIRRGKPAEDEHILLLNEGTKKTPTAGRVAYYVLCVLTVVAVWVIALLPSVLTFAILRSPVQAPLEEAYTVNLTNTTLNCSIYTEDTDSRGSGILSSNLSIPAAESSSRIENGSNCSRECRDGFYLHQELGSCRPQCGIWEVSVTSSTFGFIIRITALCFAGCFTIVVLVISALQWRMFMFTSIFVVFMLTDILAFVLLATLGAIQTWFCISIDLIDSVFNASPYCTLSGFLSSYVVHQLSLWAIFYAAILFWAVVSPFQYQTFKNCGHLKYVYTAMIIAGVLLPCVPAVINAAFGYGVVTFSPMRCGVAVQDVGFCTDALVEGFEFAILGTLQALICFKLMKHSVTKTKEGNMTISWAQKKILAFLLVALVINLLNSSLSASVSATVNSRRQLLQDYLRCEARGSRAECSIDQIANVFQTSRGVQTTIFVCVAMFPVILLPFVVNVKELKKRCKRIYSFLRATCISKG